MTSLVVSNLCVKAKATPLVQAASFALNPGDFIALLGPNGAGKTSMLRAALGLERRFSGTCLLDGKDTMHQTPTDRAQRIAYLPQTRPLSWPNRVRDIVALGRYSHGGNLNKLEGADLKAVETALTACDLSHLADRKSDTLSGGELARMHCARAFSTRAPLLIADEPVAALDPRHQFRVMDLIRQFVDAGGGALVVLHDINLAARYADRLIWMKSSQIIADGPPHNTLTAQRLADIYNVHATVSDLHVEIKGTL